MSWKCSSCRYNNSNDVVECANCGRYPDDPTIHKSDPVSEYFGTAESRGRSIETKINYAIAVFLMLMVQVIIYLRPIMRSHWH